jgi:hypothetical protein
MDSASGQIGDPVRAMLLSPVMQDGAELIPKGSMLHGKVTDVQPASKENRAGRLAIEFNVIEHAETRSLATVQTRSVLYEATLAPKEKFRDVRVDSGEQLTLILATPLKVRCRGHSKASSGHSLGTVNRNAVLHRMHQPSPRRERPRPTSGKLGWMALAWAVPPSSLISCPRHVTRTMPRSVYLGAVGS